MNRIRLLAGRRAGLTLASLLLLPLAIAADLALPWWTIDGGGDLLSTGGGFELSGTIGQPDAGWMSGGAFELAGGFWSLEYLNEESLGDMNCDGDLDGADIDPFFLAIGDPDTWFQRFPGCNLLNGDVNRDGTFDGADIDVFFQCLSLGECP